MVYQIINKIFEQSNTACSAAEAHGMAAGMLCVNEHAQGNAWMSELFSEAPHLPDDQAALLSRLFEETARLINSADFEFEMLLPADEIALSVRIDALKNWCHGFLFGVGSVYAEKNFSRAVSEILNDITEFTRLETEADGEEDENAFMEVTEYLRSAVLLLHDEMAAHSQNTLH